MIERKKTIVLNGIHGSGKTFFGTLLARNYPEQFAFFPEIGGQLRSEVDYNVLHSGAAFDAEVLKRESERDSMLLQHPRTPIVETWHTGNLAYAMVRTPGMLDSFHRTLDQRLLQMEPLVFWLHISWDTFMQRMSEKVSPEEIPTLLNFYSALESNLEEIYRKFGIPYREISNDAAIEAGLVRFLTNLTSSGFLVDHVTQS